MLSIFVYLGNQPKSRLSRLTSATRDAEIARAAGALHYPEVSVREAAPGLNYFHDGIAISGAEIIGAFKFAFTQTGHRADMRLGEVADMDVIANARAVGCIVVITINGDVGPAARRSIEN